MNPEANPATAPQPETASVAGTYHGLRSLGPLIGILVAKRSEAGGGELLSASQSGMTGLGGFT